MALVDGIAAPGRVEIVTVIVVQHIVAGVIDAAE